MRTLLLLVFLAIIGALAYFTFQKYELNTRMFQSGKATREANASGQCISNGKKYYRGESFEALDNCNTCTCRDNPDDPDRPTIICTEKECL